MHCAVDALSPQPGCFAEISTKGRFVSPAQVAEITDCQSPNYGDLIMTSSLARRIRPMCGAGSDRQTPRALDSQPAHHADHPNEASDLHARDQLVHAVVVRPKRILAQDGALRLVVELQALASGGPSRRCSDISHG
jgi:hypothetical protein